MASMQPLVTEMGTLSNDEIARYSRHVTNYYKYEDDDDDDKLLIGLAIGGLIGYAINSAGNGY